MHIVSGICPQCTYRGGCNAVNASVGIVLHSTDQSRAGIADERLWQREADSRQARGSREDVNFGTVLSFSSAVELFCRLSDLATLVASSLEFVCSRLARSVTPGNCGRAA